MTQHKHLHLKTSVLNVGVALIDTWQLQPIFSV